MHVIGSWIAAAGGIAFVAIGIGALAAPRTSSEQYGLPTTDRAALALVRALGARDVVLGLVVLRLLAAGDRDALALVLALSTLAAAGDATAVLTGRSEPAPARSLAIHGGGALALIIAAMLVRLER